MTFGRRSVLRGLGALAAAPLLNAPALAQGVGRVPVDLQLVLAVDASASINRDLLDFQLRGHAAAFRHPAVARAIQDGPRRRIAVMLAQFAGPESLTTLIPWRELADEADCKDFASTVDGVPGVAMGGSTALGSAVVGAVQLLEAAPFATHKRKIDLVSNGFSNAGIDPATAKGYAAAAGVTVNALAILDEYPWLESYYADSIIGGEGAFVRTADSAESFAESFLQKLVTEIA